MTGTILNAAAILAGGIAGLTMTRPVSVASQTAVKLLLGLFTIYVGLSTTWGALNGTFLQVLGQLGIACLALMLGNVTGKLLKLQHSLNKLGHVAKENLAQTRPDSGDRLNRNIDVIPHDEVR